MPEISPNSDFNFHAFYIIFNSSKLANKFIEHTKDKGVNCYIGYIPLHNSKQGKKLNLNKSLKNTEKYSKQIVRLPLHTNITKKDLIYIEDVFNEFFINT